jgi:hypothetical protein
LARLGEEQLKETEIYARQQPVDLVGEGRSCLNISSVRVLIKTQIFRRYSAPVTRRLRMTLGQCWFAIPID